MNPQQLSNPAPPSGYEFLYDTPAPKRRFSLPTGNSTKQRVIFFIIGFIILVMIAVIFVSFLSSSSRANTQGLIDITTEQQEIIRVAQIGNQKARSAGAKNLAITTEFTVTSSQQRTINLLKNSGHKISNKQLAIKKNSETDKKLDAAGLNNGFDEAFITALQQQLTTYRSNLKKSYDKSTSQSEKQILDESFRGTALLLSTQTAQAN